MPIHEIAAADGPLRQGEILSNVMLPQAVRVANDDPDDRAVDLIRREWAVVVSQDCDLDLDYKARFPADGVAIAEDKKLAQVLLLWANTATAARGLIRGSDQWKRIRQNNDVRYHVLQDAEPAVDAAGEGVPALTIDFKQYFTVATDELYLQLQRGESRRRCRLSSPYLEHLSTRFAYYLARVAIPIDHQIEVG